MWGFFIYDDYLGGNITFHLSISTPTRVSILFFY